MPDVFLALRVVASLAIVLGTIWYAYKRINRSAAVTKKLHPISIISRQGVAGKASVVIIESEGKRFLLGITEQNVTVLHSSDVTPASTPEETFARLLAGTMAEDNQFAGATRSAPTKQPPVNEAHSPIAGSILSPETWRRAYAAIRQGPIR